MRKVIGFIGAGILALGPTMALAAPPDPGTISPHHQTGQQVGDFVAGGGLECEDGVAPSQSGREPGPGSPFQADSISGAHYAGEQAQNQKNTTSVSQYDIACFKGPDTH